MRRLGGETANDTLSTTDAAVIDVADATACGAAVTAVSGAAVSGAAAIGAAVAGLGDECGGYPCRDERETRGNARKCCLMFAYVKSIKDAIVTGYYLTEILKPLLIYLHKAIGCQKIYKSTVITLRAMFIRLRYFGYF